MEEHPSKEPELIEDSKIWEEIRHLVQLNSEVIEVSGQNTLYKITWREKEYAVKSIAHTTLQERSRFEKALSLCSPFVIQIIGVSSDDPMLILMEWMNGRDLGTYMRKHRSGLSEKEVLTVATDVAGGLQYLHSLNIVHRDIKPENILLQTNQQGEIVHAKICDYDTARLLSAKVKKLTPNVGTFAYMAPEAMTDAGYYDEKVDIYSFAILLTRMLSTTTPWKGLNGIEIARYVQEGKRPDLPRELARDLRILITRCWSQEPKHRPPASEIYRTLQIVQSQNSEDADYHSSLPALNAGSLPVKFNRGSATGSCCVS